MDQLRRFTGPTQVFWSGFLETLGIMSGARLGILLRKPAENAGSWTRVGIWPSGLVAEADEPGFAKELDAFADACSQQDHLVRRLNGSAGSPSSGYAVGIRLESGSKQDFWVAALYLPGFSETQAIVALRQLGLAAHTPAFYRLQRAASQAQTTVSQFSSVLDLMALMNAERRFLAVAMIFCNELASRHKCDRVSLGWLEHNQYVRLQTISHTERFEKKMEAVRALEQTMEESLDQDEIIVWPPGDNPTGVTRDHEKFAESQKVKFICSVPLRLNGEVLAVLMCERNSEPFAEVETRLLSLYGEMAVRRLSELKRADRWFGARLAVAARETFAKVIGVEHTWAKVITVLVSVALGVLFFGKMNYRVESPFILRTDDIAILSAPFDGYIDEVPAQIGDPVNSNDLMLKLDTRDLLLEEAAGMADLERFTREAEKARATNALAEMRIEEAQAEQSQARLGLVRFHLSQAEIRSPFQGVIAEGDLKKRIGAPVKQGEVLFKVARTDRMYIECEVKENDIHEVRGDATGEIAFASQPKLKFPMKIERIEPVAQTKDQKNVFIVRCRFPDALQPWWRPGMSGVAKINVGKRTFFWIISHRTIDFLRMFFWI